MRPLIGITTSHATNRFGQSLTELTEAYSTAITQAGGIPILIPSVLESQAPQDLLARLDGVLFSGGGDIEARHYGAADHGELIGVEPARDQLELALLRLAVEAGKPFLGICRGCQLVNVGLGGTLYPDLATEPAGSIKHDLPGNERTVLVHAVEIEPATLLARTIGDLEVHVNSHHHQGLKRIADRLRVSGRAPDGLVEAVELPDHPFGLAVQWHPEWLTDQPSTVRLFGRFVEAAAAPH